jgi:hypothetical protein
MGSRLSHEEFEADRNLILGLADTRLPRERLPARALRDLRSRVEPILAGAIADSKRALDLGGRSFANPMAVYCGIYQLRAGLDESVEGYRSDMALWETWRKRWIQAGGKQETQGAK